MNKRRLLAQCRTIVNEAIKHLEHEMRDIPNARGNRIAQNAFNRYTDAGTTVDGMLGSLKGQSLSRDELAIKMDYDATFRKWWHRIYGGLPPPLNR